MWLSGFEAVGFAGNRQGVFARRCASDWTGRVVNVSSAAQLRFKLVKKHVPAASDQAYESSWFEFVLN